MKNINKLKFIGTNAPLVGRNYQGTFQFIFIGLQQVLNNYRFVPPPIFPLGMLIQFIQKDSFVKS